MSSNSYKKESDDYLYKFLESIQLESFLPVLKEKLQITLISHFDYVKTKDLEKIGMSKPAIRRLLDAVNRNKKLQLLPTRPAPAPPSLVKSSITTNSVFKSETQPFNHPVISIKLEYFI